MTKNRFAQERALAEAATDEPASPAAPAAAAPPGAPDPFAFEPVELRYRSGGWTPARQREYVEALADTGVVREAAARVGMSEQSANRLRRRAEARGFDLACEAAIRFGVRRLRSVAWERAIEGTVKGHYYHGELKSEERVFDNRLLVYLLGKADRLIDPPEEAKAVADNWEPWMDAIGQGLDPLALAAAAQSPGAEAGEDEEEEEEQEQEKFVYFEGGEAWEDEDGVWWTRFPPPRDFFGWEDGLWGEEDYQRTLSERELEMAEAGAEAKRAERLAEEMERRDCYFGFEGGTDEGLDGDEDEGEEDEADRDGEDEADRDEEDEADGGHPASDEAGAEARPGSAREPQLISPREAELSELSEPSGSARFLIEARPEPPPEVASRSGPRVRAL